jgi:rhamnulokinase
MPEGNRYHIAVDIGAGSGRVFAGWLKDSTLMLDELHRFETGDMVLCNKHVRNIYRWQEEVISGLKKFVVKYGDQFESIGVDSFGSDFVLLNKQQNLLKMPMAYRYAKPSQAAIDEMNAYGGMRMFSSCGNHSMKNDTLLQLIEAKIEKNSVLKDARYLLFFGDIFQFFMCGKACTEISMASYSKMFSQEKQTWDNDIFSSFAIPDCLKMPVVKYGDQLGPMYPEICKEIGLKNRPIVVTPAIHDTSNAAFAVPDTRMDSYFVSSGSWSLIGVPTDKAILSEEAWRFNASNSSMPIDRNMLKKNVTGMWLIQCCQKEWQKYSFAEISAMAAKIESPHMYFDPDADRFFNPVCMMEEICQDLKERYLADISPDNVPVIARIIFESLAMKYRYVLANLGRICGITAARLFIVGGGCQNKLLNQLVANACGIPVYAGVPEASVVGNVLCQMYGMGEVMSEAEAKSIVAASFEREEYTPHEGQEWNHRYEKFLADTCLR